MPQSPHSAGNMQALGYIRAGVLMYSTASRCRAAGFERTCCKPKFLSRAQVIEPDGGPESANFGSASAQAMRSGAHLGWIQFPCIGGQMNWFAHIPR